MLAAMQSILSDWPFTAALLWLLLFKHSGISNLSLFDSRCFVRMKHCTRTYMFLNMGIQQLLKDHQHTFS